MRRGNINLKGPDYNKKVLMLPRKALKDNIPNYPGYYVTPCGRVFSRKQFGIWIEKSCNVTRSGRGKKRKGLGSGYKYVALNNGNCTKLIKVSRLVAMVYIPNPNNKPIVMHLDNNRLNNHVSNLKWGTYKENSQQMSDDGRSTRKYFLTTNQERRLRRLKDNHSITWLSKRFKIPYSSMRRILDKLI